MNPPPTPTPPPAPAAPAFADLGVMFNDATRFLEGGLWQNVVEHGGQGFGSINSYTADLTAIQAGLRAEIAAGQFSGQTLANVNTILADITTALSAATASVSGGGAFGSIAAAETALHNSHLDILNVVNTDPNLAGIATNAALITCIRSHRGSAAPRWQAKRSNPAPPAGLLRGITMSGASRRGHHTAASTTGVDRLNASPACARIPCRRI
jgi:hypothetical protein